MMNETIEYHWHWLAVGPGTLTGEDEVDSIIGGISKGLGLPLLIEESDEWYPNELYCLRQALERKSQLTVPVGYEPYLLLHSRKPNATYTARHDTFKYWPKYMKPRPEQLAEAGFFYQGPSDRVTCHHCKMTLLNWKPTDDPKEEHRHHSPHCHFIQLM